LLLNRVSNQPRERPATVITGLYQPPISAIGEALQVFEIVKSRQDGVCVGEVRL
jgi:hypothetical protein